METQRYNGWTNYETWAVKLWLDNDESSQEYWAGRAGELLRDPRHSEYLTDEQTARQDLGRELKDEHQEHMPEVSGVYSDLLTSALDSVDWYEIAESMLTDAKETLTHEGTT